MKILMITGIIILLTACASQQKIIKSPCACNLPEIANAARA